MQFIRSLDTISSDDIALVGGKSASLGQMMQSVRPLGVRIPDGFAITAPAYWLHLTENKLTDTIKNQLASVKPGDMDSLQQAGKAIRALITQAPLPAVVAQEIKTAYATLEKQYGTNCDVAVRSSATAEDLPEASFAGQQDTYLNVQGADTIIALVPQAFASLFTDRAISYRNDHQFEHMAVGLSLCVQKMVRSDNACSGVLFTLDTETGFADVIYLTGSYGLGETIVQGSVNPDEFYVHKPMLRKGFKSILKKRCGSKEQKMIYAKVDGQRTELVPVAPQDQHRFILNDEQILELARHALLIEDFYTQQRGSWVPMDIEWAQDGANGPLYIVQARPETVHARATKTACRVCYRVDAAAARTAKVIAKGNSIGRAVVTGTARIIEKPTQLGLVKKGDIVITDMTDPDWEPIMRLAAGMVTNRGGRTCHAAIVSRELGIAAIVGTGDGTSTIHDGSTVTLDCSSGQLGLVYEGAIPFVREEINLDITAERPVQVMLNLGNPDEAFSSAHLPVDGVGLARLEFIINTAIAAHPMALVHPERIKDAQTAAQIKQMIAPYADGASYFVHKLAQEAGTIAAAFYPKPVVVRMSDFKSNEYRSLLGGIDFEPVEENPMIGLRGASRYFDPHYRDAFALECAAITYLRNEMGLVNVIPMIPFVRTLQEAQAVVELMAQHGLARGTNGLKLYMMCEIPSNVLLLEQFAEFFDGFSIGSNDLTQLTLGIDRDSGLVSAAFDERDPAVQQLLQLAIQKAQACKKPIGICGQAPSDYPEIAMQLVAWGINSMSLNPDSVMHILSVVTKQK